MGSLQEKLEKLIQHHFEGETDLETLPGGHVCGHVVSRKFDDQSYEERYRRLREVLDSGELSEEELRNVGTLLTYTPEEWSVEIEEF